MELKVVCQCGQKYKFDVEPANGRMPVRVSCPVCNADGTATADAMLAQAMASQAPSSATPPPDAHPPGSLPSTDSAPPGPVPLPKTSAGKWPAQAPARPVRLTMRAEARKPSFALGMLGGFIGALLGTAIYFLVLKFTGLQIKWLAIGVGVLAGLLARLLGNGKGSFPLGGITTVLVLAGIIGTQYVLALGWWHDSITERVKLAEAAYNFSMNEAETAVQMIPTGSAGEIRNYLAMKSAEQGEKILAATISNKEVNDFRDTRLPEYRGLASGTITKEQFEREHDFGFSPASAETGAGDGTFQGYFLASVLNSANIISLAAAAGLAFKLSTTA